MGTVLTLMLIFGIISVVGVVIMKAVGKSKREAIQSELRSMSLAQLHEHSLAPTKAFERGAPLDFKFTAQSVFGNEIEAYFGCLLDRTFEDTPTIAKNYPFLLEQYVCLLENYSRYFQDRWKVEWLKHRDPEAQVMLGVTGVEIVASHHWFTQKAERHNGLLQNTNTGALPWSKDLFVVSRKTVQDGIGTKSAAYLRLDQLVLIQEEIARLVKP